MAAHLVFPSKKTKGKRKKERVWTEAVDRPGGFQNASGGYFLECYLRGGAAISIKEDKQGRGGGESRGLWGYGGNHVFLRPLRSPTGDTRKKVSQKTEKGKEWEVYLMWGHALTTYSSGRGQGQKGVAIGRVWKRFSPDAEFSTTSKGGDPSNLA